MTPKDRSAERQKWRMFWGVTEATMSKWKKDFVPWDNPCKMAKYLLMTPGYGHQHVLRKKAAAVNDAAEKNGSFTWAGVTYPKCEDEIKSEPTRPDDEILDDADAEVGESELNLQEYIDYLGKLLNAAKAKHNLAKIAEIQPLYLKSVESRDKTDLAKLKLGFDQNDVLPREKFVQILRCIVWCLVQDVGTISDRIAIAATGCKTKDETYQAVHPILFRRRFENPLAIVAKFEQHSEVPTWVLPELTDAFDRYVENGAVKLKRFLELTKEI
jgi:hypothetical protein